jgi:hypothetical protein
MKELILLNSVNQQSPKKSKGKRKEQTVLKSVRKTPNKITENIKHLSRITIIENGLNTIIKRYRLGG